MSREEEYFEPDVKKVKVFKACAVSPWNQCLIDARITNLHVPSNVIDAFMPNVIRYGGQMWNNDDKLE